MDSIRAPAPDIRRDPESIKIVAGLLVIVAETDEKSREKFELLASYKGQERAFSLFGGWPGYVPRYLLSCTSNRPQEFDLRFIRNCARAIPLRTPVRTGTKSNLPIPNYEHSLREVYTDWSRYLIESSGKLELLSRTIVIDNIQEDNSSTEPKSRMVPVSCYFEVSFRNIRGLC